MRLSLRTLLAFEDNVFDVEQHRRLESILPTDKNAEATLQRIRSVVRKPSLGVPGLVDHQEELDPNYVAEYLDHQMLDSVQEKFETYCLSADKFLAEVASVHHILSNVLGEPAQTSRECRFRCYDALKTKNKKKANAPAFSPLEQLKHFTPHSPQESVSVKPAAFWKRWFSAKQTPQAPPLSQSQTEQNKSSLWTFCLIGMCICVLFFGWQQIENKRLDQQLREAAKTGGGVADDLDGHEQHSHKDDNLADGLYSWSSRLHEGDTPISPESKPIEQAVFTRDTSVSSASAIPIPADDPFAALTDISAREKPAGVELVREPFTTEPLPDTGAAKIAEAKVPSVNSEMPVNEESIIAFQPIGSLSKMPPGRASRQNVRPPLPPTVWQSSNASFKDTPIVPMISVPPASTESGFGVPAQHLQPLSQPQPIIQTSGIVPKVLGRTIPMSQPSVIFSADSGRALWQLPTLPFDLYGNQYLLTATPFRGTFELAAGFRIEMIGDAKLYILPPDELGVPGIFVDYGRIVIYPLQANQMLRIKMAKVGGTVRVTGTESILFVDTFAEITGPSSSTRLPEEQKQKGAILGFVPKNGEQLVWKLHGQSQPFSINTQGSMVIQSEQYRFGEIRKLPHWLEPMQMSQEEHMLAEACRRYFADANGNGEKALTWLIQDESCAVRTLGFRLWGDLGRFDIPIAVMAAKQPEDEAVRLVLVRYFDEVMLRDAETIQCFADTLEMFKSVQK